MSSQLYNNVSDSLLSSVDSTQITIELTSGNIPGVNEGDYIPIYVIRSSDGAFEIMHVTSVSGGIATVSRASENTDPLTFNAGDTVQIRPTRQSLLDMQQAGNETVTTDTGEQTIVEALNARAIKAATKNISEFPDTNAGYQQAWDWSHDTGDVIVLDRDIEITATQFWGNLQLRDGGGSITITSDASFAVNPDGGPWAAECAILMRNANQNTVYDGGATGRTDTFRVVTDAIKMVMNLSDANSPYYPIRFSGLRDSSIDLRHETLGTGTSGDANLPDFYWNNTNVKISGNYLLRVNDPDNNEGGLWIRDVNLNSDPAFYSKNIKIMPGTVVDGDSLDEPVAFFNTTVPGGLIGCGGEGYTIYCRSHGLSFLNNAAVPDRHFDVYSNNVDVFVSRLLEGQGAVKTEGCDASHDNIRVHINGFSPAQVSGSWGFRYLDIVNKLPVSTNCKVYLNAAPTGSLFDAYFGDAVLNNCKAQSGAGHKPRYSVKNNIKGIVNGGEYMGGVEGCTSRVREIKNLAKLFGPAEDFEYINARIVWDAANHLYAMFNQGVNDLGTEELVHIDVIVEKQTNGGTSVIQSNKTGNIPHDVTYSMDKTGVNDPLQNDSIGDSVVRYEAYWNSGGAIIRKKLPISNPLSKYGTVNLTSGADGRQSIPHGLQQAPQGAITQLYSNSVAKQAYAVEIENLTETNIGVRLVDKTTNTAVASTEFQVFYAVWI